MAVPPVRHTGFTLVEVVLVVGLLALLLSLAVPSYQQYRLRAYRAEAAASLAAMALCQQRLLGIKGQYDSSQCLPAPQQAYEYRYLPGNPAGEAGFTLAAVPKARQAADACGTLSINHLGERLVSTASRSVSSCWAAR